MFRGKSTAPSYPIMKKLTVSGSSVSLTHSPHLSLRDLNHLADRIQDLPTTITSLVLNSNEIQDEDCCRSNLIEILLAHESIVTFEALGNCIGSQTARKLATCLPFSKLTELKLGENRIGDEGCSFLGQALRDNVTLTRLHLGCNYITDGGLIYLANGLSGNSNLLCLGLRDNRFGALGMQALAQCLAHPKCAIEDLQLKRNNLGSGGAEALATALLFNRSLRGLELDATQLNGADIRLICAALKDNSVIHGLNVNNNNLKDEGAVAIGDLLTGANALNIVGLRGNGVSAIGATAIARALCTNTLLIRLDLASNAIRTEGALAMATALQQNQSLQSVDLQHNEIDITGLLAIAAALRTNTTLKNLDVASNFSRDRGALEWGRVLQFNTSLTRLSITDNEITERGGQALLDGLNGNTTLRFMCFGGESTIPPKKNEISSHQRQLIHRHLRMTNKLIQRTMGGGVANESETPGEVRSGAGASIVSTTASPHPCSSSENCFWGVANNTGWAGRVLSAIPLPLRPPPSIPTTVPMTNVEECSKADVRRHRQNEIASDNGPNLCDSRLLRYTCPKGDCVTPHVLTSSGSCSTPGPSPTHHTPPYPSASSSKVQYSLGKPSLSDSALTASITGERDIGLEESRQQFDPSGSYGEWRAATVATNSLITHNRLPSASSTISRETLGPAFTLFAPPAGATFVADNNI